MAIESTKTWEYVINTTVTGADIQTRNTELMLSLKQSLTNTGSLQALDEDAANISLTNPFEVVASSNGVTADATDNWDAVSDLIYEDAGTAHSWIHMRIVDYFGSGDHLHLLLACEDNTIQDALGYVAWTRGATGWNNDGTTDDRPTHAESTDVLITRRGSASAGTALTSDTMWGSDSVNNQTTLHFRISDDGLAGSWFVCSAGEVVNWQGWQYDEDGSGRTHPWTVWALGVDADNNIIAWTSILNTLGLFQTLTDAGVETAMHASGTVFGSGEALGQTMNLSTSRALMGVLLGDVTNTAIHTTLTDTWWGSNGDATGTGSPAAGPFVRRKVGEMVIDWPEAEAMQVN